MDAFGIPGGWDNPDAPDRKYLRLLKDIDCSQEDHLTRFKDMVGDAVTGYGRKTHPAPSIVRGTHLLVRHARTARPSAGSKISR